jgi:hypothetical protein
MWRLTNTQKEGGGPVCYATYESRERMMPRLTEGQEEGEKKKTSCIGGCGKDVVISCTSKNTHKGL